MGRKAGRSPDDTRRDILDAASVVLVQKGRSTSLADIARQAGVTKGGLLYHFGSKIDLLVAVATDSLQTYNDLVTSMLDPDDHEPGRLCRAYVRAAFVPWDPADSSTANPIVMAIALDDPRIAEVVDSYTADLEARLHDDGIPSEVVALVVAAADGASMQPLWWSGTDAARRQALQQHLLRLTRGQAPSRTVTS
jgi:AcrR family transcriptional regulator